MIILLTFGLAKEYQYFKVFFLIATSNNLNPTKQGFINWLFFLEENLKLLTLF